MSTYPMMAVDPRLMRASVRSDPSRRTSKIGYALMVMLLTFAVLNLGYVYTSFFPWAVPRAFGSTIPLDPLIVAVMFLPIALLSNAKQRSPYLIAAAFFWIVYSIGGFLGNDGVVDVDAYRISQVVFKILISMVIVPWLIIHAVSVEKLPQFARIGYLLVGAGATLAIVQVLIPAVGASFDVQGSGGRGIGVWANPNTCGAMCGMAVFLSLMYPLRLQTMNYLVRITLIAGLIVSLSRGSILSFVICCLVYGLASMRFATVAKAILLIVGISLASFFALNQLRSQSGPLMQSRIDRVMDALEGRASLQEFESSRMTYWKATYEAIKPNWILGLGHGQDHFYVSGQDLKSAHNYFLQVWANSGVLALLAYLAVLLVMAMIAQKCQEARIRAGLWSLLTMIVILSCFSDALMQFQYVGAFLGMFALIGFAQQAQRNPRPRPFPLRGAGMAGGRR